MIWVNVSILFFVGLLDVNTARGPLCLDCLAVDSPHECRKVTQCDTDENCFATHFAWSHDTQGFSFGCRSSLRCAADHSPSERNEAFHLCDACCVGDICNNNICTNGTVPPIGLPCLQCDSVSSPDKCTHLTYCESGGACFVKKRVTFDESFQLGCMATPVCEFMKSEIVGKRSTFTANQTLKSCHKCCQKPGCNYDVCSGTTQMFYHVPDCWELKSVHGIMESGWYRVMSYDGLPQSIYCDMTSDGGGWTVFQRRVDGSVDFNRSYAAYAGGFGNNNEFWLGNDNLHRYTSNSIPMTLRIDMCELKNSHRREEYAIFSVGSSSDNYRLVMGNYSGNMGDAFCVVYTQCANGQEFSTPDRDNDNRAGQNCGQIYNSGWWFNNCYSVNLNGRYQKGPSELPVVRYFMPNYQSIFKSVEMKFRPTSSRPSSNHPFICP